MRRLQFVVPVLALVLVPGGQSLGQASSKYDFRGAWIATVVNLDWPSSPTTSVDRQKDELRRQLDSLKAAGLNAVLLQVRAEADALYDTDRAPWSYWLTGEQTAAGRMVVVK